MTISVASQPWPLPRHPVSHRKGQEGQPPAEMNDQSRNLIAHQPHPGLHSRCSRPHRQARVKGMNSPRHRGGETPRKGPLLGYCSPAMRGVPEGVAPQVVVKTKPESTRKQKGNRNVIPIKDLDHFWPERRSAVTDQRRLALRTEIEAATARSHKLAGNSIFRSHSIFCIHRANL